MILVEGWAEELLIPELAKIIGIDLTKCGVSVVNVGNTAFLRYAKVFQREDGEQIDIPVSVITDLDIRPDAYDAIDENKKTEKDFNIADEITRIKAKYEGQRVKAFVSPHWTLEYCIALSEKLRPHLYEAVTAAGEELYQDGKTGKRITEAFDDFSNDKDDKTFAFTLYYHFISFYIFHRY